MLSKWQIWDFFSSFKRDYLVSFNGALALNTFDPICLKLVKDFLTREVSTRNIMYKMASEVTDRWIEEEFQTLSLFGNGDCFFIHQAQDLDSETLDKISKLELDGRFILLSYENELTGWKKVIKDGKLQTLMIEPPRFWEFNKLLDFVCAHLRLPLSFESKTWILDSLENNLGSFYNACCLIKLNHPEAKEVSLTQVRELLSLEKLDQFQLATLLARKKYKEFYGKLISLAGDFEKMRGFFNFLQSHLIKVADTSYLSKKSRLTNYDKDLQSASKLWKAEELMLEIDKFNQWEIMCKKKDSHLWHELKETHLKVLGL